MVWHAKWWHRHSLLTDEFDTWEEAEAFFKDLEDNCYEDGVPDTIVEVV